MAAINHPLGQGRRPLSLPIPVGRPNWWVLGAIVVVGLSALLPVLQNSRTTTRGFRNQELAARETQLDGEIRQLEADVANLTSLNRIDRRAQAIGLQPGADPIYVEVDQAGPAPAKIPAELLPALPHGDDKPESLWRSLLSRVPLLVD